MSLPSVPDMLEMVLTDGTVTLTPFRLDDAPLLMAIDRDPDCARWFDFPEITMDEAAHRTHAEGVITGWLQNRRDGVSFHFAIRIDDVAVGVIELRALRPATAAISFALAAEQRGRGYVTRAAKLLAAHGPELGFSCIELRADVDNVASQRVAERVGFRYVRLDPGAHRFENHAPFVGQARDEQVYELALVPDG